MTSFVHAASQGRMVLAALVGLAVAQQTLADAPAWAAYQQAVATLPSFAVRFWCTALSEGGTFSPNREPWGLLTVSGERFVLDLPRTRLWWDGQVATTLDKRSNRFVRAAVKPQLLYFGLFGLPDPKAMGLLKPDTLFHLTSESEKGGVKTHAEGLRGILQSADTRDTFEMWFDPANHLISRFVELYEGMRRTSRIEYQLDWDLHPGIAKDLFEPKPSSVAENPPTASGTRYRFRRSATEVPGLATLIVTVPKGVTAHLEVGNTNESGHAEFDGLSPRLRATLRPGAHVIKTASFAFIVGLVEGYDTIIDFGAVRSRFHRDVKLAKEGGAGYETTIPAGATTIEFPGSYFIQEGKRKMPLVVKPEKVLLVGP